MKVNPEELNRVIRKTKNFSKYAEDIQIDKTVEGVLEIRHFDDFQKYKSRQEYFLRQNNGELIQIYSKGLQKITPRTKLRLTGFYAKDIGLSVPRDKLITIKPGTIPPPNTLKILVILDKDPSITDEAFNILRDNLSVIFFGDDASSVKKFYDNMSYGYIQVKGDIASTIIDFNNPLVISSLINSVDPAIDFSAYDAYLFVPIAEGCQGRAKLGKNQYSTEEGVQEFGLALVTSGCIMEQNQVFHHEVGHILEFKHAGSWRCKEISPLFDEPIDVTCVRDYGDTVIMGEGSIFDLTPYHRYKLSTNVIKNQIVEESGEYLIYPMDNAFWVPEDQYSELQISTIKGYYSIAYRPPKIDVRFIPTEAITGLEDGNSAETFKLENLVALQEAGGTFQDSARNISITLLEKDSEKARVQITIP